MLIAFCPKHWRILGLWKVWKAGQSQQAQAELWHTGLTAISIVLPSWCPTQSPRLLIYFQVESIEGKPHLILVAAQDIEEREELTYDYGIK